MSCLRGSGTGNIFDIVGKVILEVEWEVGILVVEIFRPIPMTSFPFPALGNFRL